MVCIIIILIKMSYKVNRIFILSVTFAKEVARVHKNNNTKHIIVH